MFLPAQKPLHGRRPIFDVEHKHELPMPVEVNRPPK
jgi:hypothetical protein